MRGRNDETVLKIGNRHQLIHLVNLQRLQAHPLGDAKIDHPIHGFRPHIGAHRQHPLQRRDDRRLIPRRQQIGQILHRDSQAFHIGHTVLRGDLPGFGGILDRRQRRHIPDHRQGAVFGMQREGDLPFHRHFPDRRVARAFDPILGDAFGTGGGDHYRVVRVQKNIQLRVV